MKIKNEHKIMGMIGLIALRKSELYYRVLSELSKIKQVSEDEQKSIKKQISEMDNERFLTKSEKENKIINPKLKLQDLDIALDKVIKEVTGNL